MFAGAGMSTRNCTHKPFFTGIWALVAQSGALPTVAQCGAGNSREFVGGAFMGEKVQHILYSLLPLILIIFVSWFFSFLGSRVKKQTEQTSYPATAETESDTMHMVFDEDEEMESPRPAPGFLGLPMPPTESDATLWRPQPTGPQITPKPIEPKWWGA